MNWQARIAGSIHAVKIAGRGLILGDGGTQNEEGNVVAWDIIRLKLKKIIDEEDKSNPLSDDALVEALAKEGYNLARRTVTKYRKNMNIPSSRQRREY
jgi:RNA polymerase sigma-54 factor